MESTESSYTRVNGTRLKLLSNSVADHSRQEIIQLAAEPVTICVRGMGHSELHQFSLKYRHGFIREKDRRKFFENLVYHIGLLIITASKWLLPYLIACFVALVAYSHGLKKLLVLISFGSLVVCLTPLMLTKRNRQLAMMYYHYFFKREQAEDTKAQLRQKRPLFQAIYFSSVTLCFFSACSYLLYHYFGIDRETRNQMLRITISLSCSWFAFFFCRSFESSIRDYIWIAITLGSLQLLQSSINPSSRAKVYLIFFMFSYVVVKCVVVVASSSYAQVGMNLMESSVGALLLRMEVKKPSHRKIKSSSSFGSLRENKRSLSNLSTLETSKS
jgi:hypothetical protein